MSTPLQGRPVAIVGTGRMGAAMAGRLSEAGARLVLYNRSRDRAERVATSCGAQVAGTAREAVSGAQAVLVSLADDAAVEAVYSGPDGLAAGLSAGAVVLESSTVDPETVVRCEPLVTARGATLLDTPVSGSVSVVEKGELAVMVGGDAGALERIRPVFEPLARRVIHVGPLGSGAVMKLVVNSVVGALNLAVSEALVLAERAGIERGAAYEVLVSGAAAAPYVLYKREAFEHPGETPVAFMLDLYAKDLGLVEALARRVGARMDQVAVTRELVREAVASGMGADDISALAVFLREAATRHDDARGA